MLARGMGDSTVDSARVMEHRATIRFPITVRWEDGSEDDYEDEMDICHDLEDFSNVGWHDGEVTDAAGQRVLLVVSCLRLLSLMPEPASGDLSSLVRWRDGATVSPATLMKETEPSSMACLFWAVLIVGAAYLVLR